MLSLETEAWANKMAHQEKALAGKAEALNSVSRTPVAEGRTNLQAPL